MSKPINRKQLEALVWENTHKDFRSILSGEKCIGLKFNVLSELPTTELLRRLPRSVRENQALDFSEILSESEGL